MSLVGSHLGRYQLLRQIGSGGMGTIYLAQDTHMPRQVALKVVGTDNELQDSGEVSQKMEKLFYREMQTIAQLDHPHILPVYDFGRENINEAFYTYLVMQYRPEGSLTDWLRQARDNAALPLSEVARFLSQAAEALQHAHERGVVHQDVKPPNFLLRTRSSQPGDLPDLLLADFGIARFFASTSSQGMSQSHDVRGTPMFMAPEQWDGKAVPASDQYALAIMAFRLLTGQLPFQGSLGQIMRHHYMMQPPDPSSLNTQLSASIDEVIQRALAKQPSERFPSILEFAQAFAQAQAASGDQQNIQPFGASGALAGQGQIPTILPNSQTPQALQSTFLPATQRSQLFSAPNISSTLSAQIAFPQAEQPPASTPAQSSQSVSLSGLAGNSSTFTAAQTPFGNTAHPPAQNSQFISLSGLAGSTPAFLPPQPMPLANSAQMPAQNSQPVSLSGPAGNTPTFLPPQTPVASPANTPTNLSIQSSQSVSLSGLADNTPPFLPPQTLFLSTQNTPAQNSQSLSLNGLSASMPAPTPMSNPGIAEVNTPFVGMQTGQTISPPLMQPPVSVPMAAMPPAYGYSAEMPMHSGSAPAQPGLLSNPPAKWATTQFRKLTPLQTGLLIGLVALLVLGGSATLLFKGITTARNSSHGSTPVQGSLQSGGGLLPGQMPGGSNGLAGAATSTPTAGHSSTPTAGATSTPGAKPTPGTTPTPGATAKPTPTTVPPTATPKPTPHPCLSGNWSSTLNTTHAAGSSARNVSSYCGGVVYLTLTSAPASGGHEVDFQICYALNTTNCSAWVAYTGVNVWRTMASGLKANQAFYINSRCNSCTSTVTLNGGVRY